MSTLAQSPQAGARLHALSVISAALVAELKAMAAGLTAFLETPKSNPLSPQLLTLQNVAAFCGFWGVGNYLGALRELAHKIETVEPLSIAREEFLDRVKTLGAGVNGLGVYLLDLSAGNVVSYTALNEQFARVIRKARPALLDMDPAQAAPLLFMAAPPSLEVDALWTPSSGASREAFVQELGDLLDCALSEASLRRLAVANPYRSLAGLLDGACALHEWVCSQDVAADFLAECERLHSMLGAPNSFGVPPAPDGFLFSRLLHRLATVAESSQEIDALRKRYSLMRPGSGGTSKHDIAKKFVEGMRKFEDAFRQAALTKTSSMVRKLTASLAADAHRLDSPAFTTFAAALQSEIQAWPAEPGAEEWIRGAAFVLLLKASAQTWGNLDAQESLASVADLMAGTRAIHTSQVVQAEVQATAIKKACACLQEAFVEIHKGIEGSLKTVGARDLEGDQAKTVATMAGGPLARHLRTVEGVVTCLQLPFAARFAAGLLEAASEPESWRTGDRRAALFEELSRLNLFIGRLRPGSLLDLDPDEVGVEAEGLGVPQQLVAEPDAGATSEQSFAEPTLPAIAHEDAAADTGRAFDGQVHGGPDADRRRDEAVRTSDAPPANAFAPAVAPPVSVAPALEAEAEHVGNTACDGQAQSMAGSARADSSGAAIAADSEWGDFPGSLEDLDQMPARLSAGSELDGDSVGDDLDFLPEMATVADLPGPEELREEFLGAAAGHEDALDRGDTELLNIMFEESWECMDGVDRTLLQVSQGGAAPGMKSEASRYIHTLKGVCRTCGLEATGLILHAMEDRLDVMSDDGELFSKVVAAFIGAMQVVRARLERARAEFHGVPASSSGGEPGATPEAPEVSTQGVAADAGTTKAGAIAAGLVHAASGQQDSTMPARAASGGTVRIPVALADKVGTASSHVVTAGRRAREDLDVMARTVRELEENLRRVGEPLRELQMMASASIASTHASAGGAQGFDPLELDRYTQMQEVTRRLVEAYEDSLGSARVLSEGLRSAQVSEQDRQDLSDELQRGSSELLLVPLSSQLARFEKVVAKACADTGKDCRIVIETGCRVPASALDRLLPVLDHIVRNAVAHGIEVPDDRRAAGKAAEGRVTIGAPTEEVTEGGSIRLCVRDDGAGIDLERVKAVAVQRGLVKASAQLSPDATRELLFMPGFSTASSVSELAGRGVGLDVVRSSLSSLGGMVSVNSEQRQGTEFVLTLPTDAATMAVVPVSAAGFNCLLPLTLVRRIVPVSAGADVEVDVAGGLAKVAGHEFELVELAQRVPANKQGARSGRGHLVLMRQSNVVKAVLVDTVGQQTRVVAMPLGPFVRDVPGMVAGTSTPAGGASLIVNPLQLAVISTATKKAAALKPAVMKTVMVVDDSSTVRLVTSRFLKRSGYLVEVARDGLEALQLLAKGLAPDVFLFDLEMPGMGGFELIAEVRRKERFHGTPIVVVTSRTAEKHRQRAMELGATRYLTKPYEDANLLQLLGALLPAEA